MMIDSRAVSAPWDIEGYMAYSTGNVSVEAATKILTRPATHSGRGSAMSEQRRKTLP